jgi:hypothetical protein
MECSLGPSQATSLLDFFTESKIGEGITSKSKFFSIDISSMEDRLDSDVDQEDSKGRKAFSEWKLEKSVKRSGLLDELKKLQPEFDFEALKDKASLKKIITANNINGYDYIIEICNSIQANKKDSKTPKVLGRLKSFFKK